MIKQAQDECDFVFVIVSLTSRERPGEVIITKEQSKLIWVELERTFDDNVRIIYTGEEEFSRWGNHTAWVIKMKLDDMHRAGEVSSEVKQTLENGPKINTPVGWTWWLMSALHLTSKDVIRVYVGPDDTDRFPRDKIDKYAGPDADVTVVVVGEGKRLFDVSGTKMREWLGEGRYDEFIANLPTTLSERSKKDIWRLLMASGVTRAPVKKIKNGR